MEISSIASVYGHFAERMDHDCGFGLAKRSVRGLHAGTHALQHPVAEVKPPLYVEATSYRETILYQMTQSMSDDAGW